MPAHELCQPTGNKSSTTHGVVAGAVPWYLFPPRTCCGFFTGSSGVPAWGSQHSIPGWGSRRVWGCLNLLWVLRAVPRPGEIRHLQWMLRSEGMKVLIPMHEHLCLSQKGTHAKTHREIMRALICTRALIMWVLLGELIGCSCTNCPGAAVRVQGPLMHEPAGGSCIHFLAIHEFTGRSCTD